MDLRGSIAFVSGTDRLSAPPPVAHPHRFAVLTWLESDGSSADPWALLAAAIPPLVTATATDAVLAEFLPAPRRWGLNRSPGATSRIVPWNQLLEDTASDAERDFPHAFRFVRGDVVILEARTEDWSAAGGPAPYHDSVTLSFYSAQPLDDILRQIFTTAARELGLAVGSA